MAENDTRRPRLVADAAAKSADITLFRIHFAMAIGGKGFVLQLFREFV